MWVELDRPGTRARCARRVSTPPTRVHLRELPVATCMHSQEQSEGLLCEFALIAAEGDPGCEPALPARLLELVDAVNAQYSGLTGPQEAQLWQAHQAGRVSIDDLVHEVPVGAGEAARALGRMLDEADDCCRAGEHLLTLAADEVTVRFRWCLDQFTDQLGGASPVPWPQYSR